ncbi:MULTISPECIES: ABC transporter permease [unclassified Rhizobium]|uniref:ABC transporter permease n=1 Tax=unclassified Rhizobium TaxID=2613769 RepID=UPI001CC74BBC|nr:MULTISPECIES: ABC transporter permease [unclassified Rhizobium]MBZ5762176.1 ABC transporter permease [Rhizobium sp. VS19-DR96]MBZ5767659.1 ABC transporter permease [Rhizobium sp. VS19-DR129.2]MBZ5775434.1 ABC transporter permease [Rhizobium sp. VS19-DRK62.2]MBZ5786143.1 ABC transporter permease [Rhizobium sp. VS19-DR121]MBZ5803755.1 ABC transporter permease [Rhizobium sp. VS19-DR181]
MFSYIVRRILQMIPTIVFILIVTFVLIRLLPGDPASAMLGDRARDADVLRINASLGLDKPVIVQFFYFVRRIATGDLGDSITLKTPVVDLIAQRMPVTLMLIGMAAVIALLLAVPLAFVAALRREKTADTVIRGTFQVGLSMPVFYIGILLLTLFAANLKWFPVGGYGDTFGSKLYHLFLPALTLALSFAAVLMRNLRTAIIGVINAEYVDFARSKGLKSRVILIRHVLRNALISTITLFGLQIGSLLGGGVITETVFAVPGAGRLMIDSIYGRDYPVLQGLTIALAVLVSLTFLVTDIVQAWLDPRVAR